MPRGSAIIHPSCARTCSTYTRINMRGAHISVHTTESGLFTNNFTCNFEPAVAIKPGTRFARQTRERLIPGVSGCQTAKEGKRPSMEFGILPKISSSYTPKIYEYQYFCLTNIEPTPLIHIMFPNWSYIKIIKLIYSLILIIKQKPARIIYRLSNILIMSNANVPNQVL